MPESPFVRDLLTSGEVGAEYTVRGWVRSRRGSKNVSFVIVVDGCECLSADANAIGAGGPSDFWARAVVVVAAAAADAFASASLTFALCSNPHGSDPGVRFSPAAAASARSFSICFIQKASTSSLVLWCSVPSS